jgi:hypothetical protein
MHPEPEDLARDYLEYLDVLQTAGHWTKSDPNPLSVWEDWIVNTPERAWPVFLELLRHRPDIWTLEQIRFRMRALLARHWDSFHERVRELVANDADLRSVTPPRFLEWATYHRQFTPAELAAAFFAYYEHSPRAIQLDELTRTEPYTALPLVLELIRRGPNCGFDAFDVCLPMQHLLRNHASAVIEPVEAAAAESSLVRKVLWRITQLERNRSGRDLLPDAIRARIAKAAGQTTEYSQEPLPVSEPRPLPGTQEALVAAWIANKQAAWASVYFHKAILSEPDRAWEGLLTLVAFAQSDEQLRDIAHNLLMWFLAKHGDVYIERVEVEAARDPTFRRVLGKVFKVGIPDAVWARILKATGNRELAGGIQVPRNDDSGA